MMQDKGETESRPPPKKKRIKKNRAHRKENIPEGERGRERRPNTEYKYAYYTMYIKNWTRGFSIVVYAVTSKNEE